MGDSNKGSSSNHRKHLQLTITGEAEVVTKPPTDEEIGRWLFAHGLPQTRRVMAAIARAAAPEERLEAVAALISERM